MIALYKQVGDVGFTTELIHTLRNDDTNNIEYSKYPDEWSDSQFFSEICRFFKLAGLQYAKQG